MNRTTAWVGMGLAAAIGVSRGCDCGDDPFVPVRPWSCDEEGRRPGPDDTPCGSNKRFVKGECQPIRCDAGEQPPGCCPGMICTQGGECLVPPSRITLCSVDSECDDGQLCLTRPLVHAESKTCGFPPLAADGTCPEGSRPFNGRCVGATLPPCTGDCPPGTVCNIDTNRCEDPPALAATDHGCNEECGAAQLLVYNNPDQMLWDQCCEVTCACLTLPPLAPGRWGRFSDIAIAGNELLVSAYDGTFGDLVLGRFDKQSTLSIDLDYVDGLPPPGSTVVADPTGPRGGQDNPGPDVGTYTSIAVAGGEPRIAYYDVEAQNLKYARYDSLHGEWVVVLVDDGRDITATTEGDVGRFSSLVVDDAGIAHISYYAHRVLIDGALVTTPMYARALDDTPLVYEDWERVPIDPVTACPSACTSTQACAVEAAGPTCLTARSDCASACPCDETCVDVGGAAVCRRAAPATLTEPCDGNCQSGFACVAEGPETLCRQTRENACTGCQAGEICVDDGAGAPVCRTETPYSTIEGLPEGVGLFTSLALHQNRPVVVYYDRLLRQLRGAVASFEVDEAIGDFTADVLPVGCAVGADNGISASLAVSPEGDTLGVAYQGDGGETLWYYSGADFTTGTTVLVDEGLRGSRVDLVGGGASLAFGASRDEPLIAYADQTENDLVLAHLDTGAWVTAVLLGDGAHGSFPRLAVEGRRLLVTAYQRERDDRNRDISRLQVVVLDLDSLP